MNEKDLLQQVKHQLVHCHGYEGDEVASARAQALDYYFQRVRGDEVAGRSAVVSGDVSAMVEANLAQMMDAFSSDNVIEFEPYGPDDEDQAQLESCAVQYLVMGRNNGFVELSQAIKDALLLRNGIVKVWVDERSKTVFKTYRNVEPEALADLADGADIVDYDDEKGVLKVRETIDIRDFRSKAVPPENFLWAKDYDSQDLQKVEFCAERHLDTRSDLREMGFSKKKVEELLPHKTNWKIDAVKRNPLSMSQDSFAIDKSQEQVEWYECYALIDHDGDGVAERRRICVSNDTILSNDPCNLVPYAAGTAILNPHRFMGISLFDKLKQSQDTRTALKRALLDNVNTTTKNRLAYLDGKVNVDDVSDGRPNGAIRVKPGANVQDVRQAVMPFAIPDTSANILQNLESSARERAEMGGAALDLQTASAQIGGDRMGSQGLDRAYSVMEQLAAMMLKNIAATLIRSLFLLAHATLRENYDEEVPVKREGNWISPIPAQWTERRSLAVKPGMSPGERARKSAALQNVLQSQVSLAEQGMDDVLVNVEGFYKVLMDWARNSDIQNPEQYFIDPRSEEAQAAMKSKAEAANKQTQLQQSLTQQAIGLEQMRLSFEKYKQDAELQFKYWDSVLGAEVEEAKIVGKATTDLLKTKTAGKANGQDRAVKASEAASEE
jgi:hypothetical protein